MSTIVDFLLARIAEDDRKASNEAILRDGDPYFESGEASAFERTFKPTRVLAECAAKRAIIKARSGWEHLIGEATWDGSSLLNAMESTIRAIASVYRDHPDYQPEWAPDFEQG